MFSQNFIAKVKDATNLLDLVKEHVEVKPAGVNKWQSRCTHPDHNDSTPSFRVWKNKDKSTGKYSWSWACMGCHQGRKSAKYKNYGSDCFAFVQWMSDHNGSRFRMNWRQSIEYLADKAGIKLEEEKYSAVYKHIRRQANAYAANLIDPIRNYLNSRGLDDTILKDWIVGFDGKRITFPLPDRYRQIIGFSNRKIGCMDDSIPKYKNSPTSEWFNKGSYFYGIHLYDSDFDEIRITEGTIDVIIGKKFQVQNLFSTLGTSFTADHAEAIKSMGKIPCFCMDGDSAGESAARRAIDMMAEIGVHSKILFLPQGMDMADLANKLREDTEQYIQDHSMTYWQYLMKDIVAQYDAKMNEINIRLYPAVKKIMEGIPTEGELVVMKSFIKNRMGLDL